MPRPRHSRRELEEILREAENRGWRVQGGGHKYFKMKCPCPDMHLKMVHLTPSRHYAQNLKRWLERLDCWESTE